LQDREVIDLSEDGFIIAPVPFIVVANKADHPDAAENLEVLKELWPDLEFIEYRIMALGLEDLRKSFMKCLNIIGSTAKLRPSGRYGSPLYFKKRQHVIDFAEQVHKDFPTKLKSALVWGSSKFDGQAVAPGLCSGRR
jgi:uncharacterized protein